MATQPIGSSVADTAAARARLHKLAKADSGMVVLGAGQGLYDVCHIGMTPSFSPVMNGAFGVLGGAQVLIGASVMRDAHAVGNTPGRVLGALRVGAGLANIATACGAGTIAGAAGLGLTLASIGYGFVAHKAIAES